MTWEYENAGPGNVALMAELPRRAVLALGFGSSAEAAATLAISSLLQPFDNLLQQHITPWQTWQAERSERCAVPLDIDTPRIPDQKIWIVGQSHQPLIEALFHGYQSRTMEARLFRGCSPDRGCRLVERIEASQVTNITSHWQNQHLSSDETRDDGARPYEDFRRGRSWPRIR